MKCSPCKDEFGSGTIRCDGNTGALECSKGSFLSINEETTMGQSTCIPCSKFLNEGCIYCQSSEKCDLCAPRYFLDSVWKC